MHSFRLYAPLPQPRRLTLRVCPLLPPLQVALFMGLANLPWTLKPLIGFISDSVPLFGYRRRSYLLLASGAGA